MGASPSVPDEVDRPPDMIPSSLAQHVGGSCRIRSIENQFNSFLSDFEKCQSGPVCCTLSPVRKPERKRAARMLQVHVLKMLATETNPGLLFLQKLLQLLGSKCYLL